MEKRHLLLVGIGVVGVVLREVVELLAVLIQTAQTLLRTPEACEPSGPQGTGAHEKSCGIQPMVPSGHPE
jgi:hypothetical protein